MIESKGKNQGLVWGGLLIIVGFVALLETFFDLSAWVWVAILAVCGFGTYAIYAKERSEKWLLVVSYGHSCHRNLGASRVEFGHEDLLCVGDSRVRGFHLVAVQLEPVGLAVLGDRR